MNDKFKAIRDYWNSKHHPICFSDISKLLDSSPDLYLLWTQANKLSDDELTKLCEEALIRLTNELDYDSNGVLKSRVIN